MKGYAHISLISLTWLILMPLSLRAQESPFDPSLSREASGIHEEVSCFTDRSLYITEEVIRFRAGIQCTGLSDGRSWSSVLYVELISAAGKQVASGKFPVHSQVACGQLLIPSGIPTGNYLLRAYTRWMRNQGPESYSYAPLKIINPHSPKLVPEDSNDPVNHKMTGITSPSASEDLIEFEKHPSLFNQGDLISLKLHAAEDSRSWNLEGCLSAVPVQARPLDQSRISQEPGDSAREDFQVQFLPDLNGPTLSGTVFREGGNEQPVKDSRIHFTLLGNDPGYYVTRSDTYGRFALTITDREGKVELFIQPESPEEVASQVRIERDFDPGNVVPALEPFRLSTGEKQMATAMARKVQLASIYRENPSLPEPKEANEPVPFYGQPSFSVDLNDFVLLPTLEEVFFNLVPNVLAVTRKKETTLLIRSENPSISLYDPLIMIDGVPCFNIAQLLALPPSRIRTIDVVEDVYVKGDLRFGGIINLHSVDKDMAGIDLPPNSFFIDFLATDPPPADMEELINPGDQMPDIRNTLLWIPDLLIKENNPSEISFKAPDYPGEYVVLFRGLDKQGKVISAETSIHVQ